MALASSAVGASARGPRTAPRIVPCPARNATLGPSAWRSTRSRYSANVVQAGRAPTSAIEVSIASRPSSVTGATPSPQLPESWVVNPWARWLTSAPSTSTDASECPWMSMNPGATTRPAASITIADSPASTAARSPTAAIRSPSTPTSAGRPGAPVPSRSVPPRTTRSKGIAAHGTGWHTGVAESRAVASACFNLDADLNSSNCVFTVPLAAMGLTLDSQFDFTVLAYDTSHDHRGPPIARL